MFGRGTVDDLAGAVQGGVNILADVVAFQLPDVYKRQAAARTPRTRPGSSSIPFPRTFSPDCARKPSRDGV